MKRSADYIDKFKNEGQMHLKEEAAYQIYQIKQEYLQVIKELEMYYADESHELCSFSTELMRQDIETVNEDIKNIIKNTIYKKAKV